MPDFVQIGKDTIPVPAALRGDGKAIAAWIATQQKAAHAAAKE